MICSGTNHGLLWAGTNIPEGIRCECGMVKFNDDSTKWQAAKWQAEAERWKALAGEMKVCLFDLLIHHKDGCENANHRKVDEIFNDVDILLAKAREADL